MKQLLAVAVVGAFLLGAIGITVLVASTSNAELADNTNYVDGVDTPPPTDEQQVLAQLTELEKEWTVANLSADKKKLWRILADDYVGPVRDGRVEGKADYIRTVESNTSVERWEINDLQLWLTGDRATLSGKITYVTQGQPTVFEFVDKFVWRDGRWQATSAELKQGQ